MNGPNLRAVAAIYKFELHRFRRTWLTGLLVPVITTSLYFIVFGGAIGSRMTQIDGIPYAAFIVPGLIMMSMFTESIFNASFGIYMPKFTGTIYELLSAPVSAMETVIAYVGAAATKALIVGFIIFATAHLFVDLPVAHPFAMVGFMLLIAVSFCLFGLFWTPLAFLLASPPYGYSDATIGLFGLAGALLRAAHPALLAGAFTGSAAVQGMRHARTPTHPPQPHNLPSPRARPEDDGEGVER